MNHQADQEIKVNTWVQIIRVLVVIALIAVIAFVGIEVRQNMSSSKYEKAFSALYKAEAMEEASVRDTGVDKAPNLDDLIAKWSPEKKAEYVEILKKVLADHPKTPAAYLAGLKLASFQFRDGKAADAETSLQNVISQIGGDDTEVVYKVLALESLGSLHESQSQLDKAYDDFKKASDLHDNPLKPLSYLSAARVLRNQGKAKEAQELYQKIVVEFPNSDYEKQARALMALKAAG